MMIKQKYRKIAGMVVLLTGVVVLLLSQVLWAAPKSDRSKVQGGNCAGCHAEKNMLPEKHVDTKSMTWDSCRACHTKDNLNLIGKLPGSHVHQLLGVNCVKCHGNTRNPEALTMEQCVACHGSTTNLVERTKNVKPNNPHTSPHYGNELDCNMCHHQHAKSEDYCAQCHKFNFKTP